MNFTIDDLLRGVVQKDASDLILKADCPPLFRVYGDCIPLKVPPVSNADVKDLVYSILTGKQKATFETELELDLSYEIPGFCRYRVNVFQQRGSIGFAARAIPFKIRTMEELNLPIVCRDFCERPRGLVLVTGPTGSGKSTSLAAMIDYINKRKMTHIVTIEDPMEFVYQDDKALINQRELGTDTPSFQSALRRVTRQDPDVILVGEMRDLETMRLAITAAETGHLVFGTLHTTDAAQTVDRIIDVFPPSQQGMIRAQLSVNLVGAVSQTLLKRKDGKGRIAAFEVLVGVSSVRNMIRESKTYQLPSTIQTGSKFGMIALDTSLVDLVARDIVTYEAAYDKSTYPQNFDALYQEHRKRVEQELEEARKAAERERRR